MRLQDRDHFFVLLIGHGAKDDPDSARIEFLQECGERFGYYILAKQYHERLGLPIMHTETNAEDDAVDWLYRQWTSTLRLNS